MKKTFSKIMMAMVAASLMLAITGCGSTKVEDKSAPAAKEDDGADKVVIADWSDRTMGEEKTPVWLVNMTHGNSSVFKEQFNIDANRVVKRSRATGKTIAIAQANSRANFAYTQAAELTQKVIGRVGQGLNDVGELEALFLAASETKADMSGLREEHSFYQKVRTTDAVTKATKEEYVYWTIYSMSKESWDALVKSYLMNLMKGANFKTQTLQEIANLYPEMSADTDKKDAKEEAKEQRDYERQVARLNQVPQAQLSPKEAESKQNDEEAAYYESFFNKQ